MALAAIPFSPAFAFVSSGNPIADMAYAMERNRGTSHAIANQLAKAAGASVAGTSLWSRILGRTPLRRLFWVANLLGTAYWIYSEASGSFTENTGDPVASGDWFTIPTLPFTEIGSDQAAYNAFRAAMAPNSFAIINSRLPNFYYNAHLLGCRYMRRVSDGTHTRVGQYLSKGSGSEYNVSGAPLYSGSHASDITGSDGLVYAKSVFLIQSGELWNWENLQNYQFRYAYELDLDYGQARPVLPENIPGHATVAADRIAEDVNEAYAQARAADPMLPEVAPYQAAEVEAVAPSGTISRSVEAAKLAAPSPTDIPDPGTGGSGGSGGTGGTGGSGGGTVGGGPSGWGEPVPVPLPDDVGVPEMPEVGSIDDRPGNSVCPALPGGITYHCPPLLSARDKLVGICRALGSVATFMMILKD